MRTYNVKDVAYILGVSEYTVYVWIEEGKLKPIVVRGYGRGSKYRIKETDLEECLCNHTQQALTQILRFNEQKARRDYLDYLDAREEELYNEVCVLEQVRHYLEKVEL